MHLLPLLLIALLLSSPALAGQRERDRAREAVTVLNEIMASPDHRIPVALIRDAHAIAVIPNVVKAGLMVGARRGRGLLSVRGADGTWSHPIFITLTGGSFGFQAGVQSTDVVLVFRSPRGVDNIVNGKFTLGADAAVAAGPVGRNAQLSTDAQLQAEIFAYSRSRGLFAGVALDGTVLQVDNPAVRAVYGREVTPRRVFSGQVSGVPGEFIEFRDALEEAGAR